MAAKAAGYIAPYGSVSRDEQEHALRTAEVSLCSVDDDPGPDRVGLWQLVELVRRGDVSVIYVTSIRTMGPDVASQEVHRGLLERAGAVLRVLDHDDEATEDRATARAYDTRRTQAERLETRWRLSRGRERAAAAGEWTGGRSPMGWERVAGELVESAREQAAITRASQLRRGGSTLRQIAGELTSGGYLTKDGRDNWSAEQVRRLLAAESEEVDDGGDAEGDRGEDPGPARGGGEGEAPSP